MIALLGSGRVRTGLGQARYRVGQVARGFATGLSPAEVQLARSLLGPAELRLFASMHPRDRRHSMDLLHHLERGAAQDGEPSRELRQAALLHDVGKGHLELWDRVGFVLLRAVSPALADTLGSEGGQPWQRALWRLHHHAALGAERLVGAGSSARVVDLVRGHTSDPHAAREDPELVRLIEADRRT
ncbi:MAG: HD domain-containing protein [Dehalococcoidia bacterium]|nr:HD domain-containing protein [Dehalococcoidia bacterium]